MKRGEKESYNIMDVPLFLHDLSLLKDSKFDRIINKKGKGK